MDVESMLACNEEIRHPKEGVEKSITAGYPAEIEKFRTGTAQTGLE